MPILQEQHHQTGLPGAPGPGPEEQQRRRMLIALVVLLLALVLVLVKDRQLLFPETPAPASEDAEPEPTQPPSPVVLEQVPPVPPPAKPLKKAAKRVERKPIVATILPDTKQNAPVVMASSRAMLPPLEVEVVAGNQRHPIDAGTNSVNVKMQDALSPRPQNAPPPPGTSADPDSSGTERVQLSPGTAQMVSHPVDPSYPLLAKQMKVQGAVVMEALIGKSGAIQEIQVLSGPAILSAAAREAVRQWRFKPYLQAGKPVDSEAKITVNFTISTY